jgi:hypothetical protein
MTHRATLVAAAALSTLIMGCGGGGGADDGGGPPSFPASGTYGWVLKASGATDALKYGLSFVHPSRPDTEYVIEIARDVVSDARVVTAGGVDTVQLRATGNQAYALVYIVGGDVRSVPMAADGTAPRSRVQRALSTSACRFVIEANDYATPQNSRYIVSTAGADGQCNTTDDGRAEVRLAASGALGFTPLSGDLPLAVVRDPATLAPRGWVYPRNVSLWTTTPATVIATRPAPATHVGAVLSSSHDAALVADGTRLAVFRYGATTVTESALDAVVTAGNGWQPIGFDATHFYAYLNAGSDFSSAWKVVRVARSNPSASVLASGVGLVAVTGMGRDMLYLTILGQSGNQLIRLAKSGGAPATTNSPTSTLETVVTSADTVHQRWRVSGIGTAALSYVIEFVDEADNVRASVPGGFPLSLVQAGTQDFNNSESRTRFLVAGNYGSRAFGDASLVAFDSAAPAATTLLGTLPGSADFGSDPVFANASGGPEAFGLGFAARSSAGVVQETGAKVFSFDPGVANSLRFTSRSE